MTKVDSAGAKSEFACKNLQKEFGEELPDRMLVAILINMLPLVVQDFVMQTTGETSNLGNVLERVKSWIWNRVSLENGPKPMGIGEVDHTWEGEGCRQVCADDAEAVGPETT